MMKDKAGKMTDKAVAQNSLAPLMNLTRWDQETKRDKMDRLIVKIFPYFIIVCIVFSAIITYILGSYDFAGIIYGVCFGFVICFCALGVVCMVLSDRGDIPWKVVMPVLVLIPIFASVILYSFGDSFDPSMFLVKFFDIFSDGISLIGLVVSMYTIVLMIMFSAYGVVSVIVGYFRSYFYKILRSMEYPPEKRKNHVPEWLFQVPDIIDVKSVELEPDQDDVGFNAKLFFNTAVSIFVLGLVICSYLFLNPFFLQEIMFEEMILISTMLSMFLSPLVIPWSIVRSVGAKVKSDAPRDLYLWKGMRGRLYQGFFAVTFFMMLLTLSAYMGMDFSRIATTYLAYILFMALISGITSFVYVNKYYRGFKNGIVKSYMRSKQGRS